MADYWRYGIYYLPPAGSALAAFGARWLGWDVEAGCAVASLAPDLTETPRKYGFHGTLKPPFRLADGRDAGGLEQAVVALGAAHAPVAVDGLALSRLGRFFALTPLGDTAALDRLAAACVRDLDAFRAPPAEAELERRRARGLSAEQEANLSRWGYPFVMEAFRFHLTLTGAVPASGQDAARARLEAALPPLPAPYPISEIALVGERADGAFETIRRVPLGGQTRG
jgi:putative phosphonate metabolism protein